MTQQQNEEEVGIIASVETSIGNENILYYKGKFFRIFKNHQDKAVIMSTALMVGFLEPDMKMALFGVISSRGSNWVAKKIHDNTGLHLGLILDKIPLSIQRQMFHCSEAVTKPIKWIFRSALTIINQKVLSEVLAPVVEESIYRFGIQNGIAFSLKTLGCNNELSSSVGIFCASLMFGFAHNCDLSHPQFIETMIPGIIFGIIQEYGGFPEAVLTHSFHNLSMRFI